MFALFYPEVKQRHHVGHVYTWVEYFRTHCELSICIPKLSHPARKKIECSDAKMNIRCGFPTSLSKIKNWDPYLVNWNCSGSTSISSRHWGFAVSLFLTWVTDVSSQCLMTVNLPLQRCDLTLVLIFVE